jgi:protein TonB
MKAIHSLGCGGALTIVVFGLVAGCALPGGGPGSLSGGYVSAFQAEVKPVLLAHVSPVYPSRLYRLGIRGDVMIFFIVERDGTVREAQAVDRPDPTDAEREFEAAALAAVRGWKFRPGEKNGAPVRVSLRIPFGFGDR